MRKQRVAVLHERIRRQRQRSHVQPAFKSPLVQYLDVLGHELELEPAGIDVAGRERPDHEGVVGIGGMAEPDQHSDRA